MTEASKIPVTKLLLHVINVLHVCDLSSVTTDRVKDYLKDRFRNALPCENELDFILRNVIKTVKLSQNLNPDSVLVKEDNYEYEKEDSGLRDQDFQDQPIKERIQSKKRKPTVSYALKKGPGGGPNTCKAKWYSLKIPGTSKTTRIFKPFLSKNTVASEASKAVEKAFTDPSKENTKRDSKNKISGYDDNSDDQTSAVSEDNDSRRIHSKDRGYRVKPTGPLTLTLQKPNDEGAMQKKSKLPKKNTKRRKKKEGKERKRRKGKKERKRKKESACSSISEEPIDEEAVEAMQKKSKLSKRKTNENRANAHGKETTESKVKKPTFNPDARHTKEEIIDFLKEHFKIEISEDQITEDQITKVVRSSNDFVEALTECTHIIHCA